MTSRVDMKMPDFTSRRFRFHYLTAINLLQSMDISLDNIHMKAAGIYENYRGEIRSQEPEPGAVLTRGTMVTLEVGCESAIDFMPYQFFYGLQGIRDTDNTWEDEARCLMAPFDAATIRYEAAMRMHSLKNSFGVMDEEHLRRFMALFEFDSDDGVKSGSDMMFIAAILPSLHSWGGNPAAVSAVLERLTGFEVSMKENVRAKAEIPSEIRYRLGSRTGRLGCETIIGSEFEECDSTYEVSFAGVPKDRVGELLSGGKVRRRVERFLDFCMPGDLDYKISVKVEKKMNRQVHGERPPLHGEGTQAHDKKTRVHTERTMGHLGYSTYL
ncbi:MAG: type VI secretion system baseplate subunit TssG [Candidatus Krumholzibacteria bacterium]|nr:type VI secretion system baseplate subunit TssG [Candidatus Krumholzibacteria bacterium]